MRAYLTLASFLGLDLTAILAWQVPRLFHNMPEALYRDLRISVPLVGASLSFTLLCSVFSAVFVGLQQYGVPTAITVINRGLYTLTVCLIVHYRGSLIVWDPQLLSSMSPRGSCKPWRGAES
jgi:hypothetical protein